MTIVADIAQTFYLEKNTVKKADIAFIKSVDLFLRNKPTIGTAGITVYICETTFIDGFAIPNLSAPMKYGRSRKSYSQINTSLDGLTATTFDFTVPVPVKTDRSYAICVKIDFNDNDFTFWANKTGDINNQVSSTSVTQGALDGRFFTITNGGVLTPLADTDLKFKLKVQKFNTSNTTYSAVNRDFELVKVDPTTIIGDFIGGEIVFASPGAVSSQTVNISATSTTVTGTGTTFLSNYTSAGFIILKSGTSYAVRAIESVANNTSMTLEIVPPFSNASAEYVLGPVARVYKYEPSTNSVFLYASTANATHNFFPNTNCNTIIGEISNASATVADIGKYRLNRFEPSFGIVIPSQTFANTTATIAANLTSSVFDGDIQQNREKWKLNESKLFFSRSDEIANGTSLTNGKSLNFNITFGSNNEFTSPFLDEEDMHFHAYQFAINNDLTDEHKSYGNAVAKYVSKRITLAEGQDSEDLKLYLTAFKPSGTDIVVYAKFYNEADPDLFADKDWTRLELKTSPSVLSSPGDWTDYVELEYSLPAYPIANTTTKTAGDLLAGRFTIANNQNIATGTSGTVNASPGGVAAGDLVRIYNPLFPNNSLIAVVTASTSTNFTFEFSSANVSTDSASTLQFVNSGLQVEKVTYKNTAFKNFVGNNVIRYFNTDMAAFDTYKNFAFKIVMLSSSDNLYPFIDDLRGIAVSV